MCLYAFSSPMLFWFLIPPPSGASATLFRPFPSYHCPIWSVWSGKEGLCILIKLQNSLSSKLFSVNGGREGGIRSFRRSRSFRGLSELIGQFKWSLFAGVCFGHISGLYGPSLFVSLAARTPEEGLSSFLAYFWLLNLAGSVLGVHNLRNCVVNSWERSIEGKGLAVIN